MCCTDAETVFSSQKVYLYVLLLETGFPVQIPRYGQIASMVPWSFNIYTDVAIGFSENQKIQEIKNHFVA